MICIGKCPCEAADGIALGICAACTVIGKHPVSVAANSIYVTHIRTVSRAHTVLKNYKSIGAVIRITVEIAVKQMPSFALKRKLFSGKSIKIIMRKIENATVGIMTSEQYTFIDFVNLP